MSPRRLILFAALSLLLFLGIYTWNQRTGHLDIIGANTGLEFSGVVERMATGIGDSVAGVFHRYVTLVDVQQENDRLKEQLRDMEMELSFAYEERAELERLRRLLRLDFVPRWPAMGARVLAGRTGSNAALESIMLSRGYLTGARPGTPIVMHNGLVGRVLKSGPSTSVALLVTDPGSRVAVVSSRGRVQGILAGGGAGNFLQMRFVRQNSYVEAGELLVTSGVDAAYPKGVPVARVVALTSGTDEIYAEPLVDFDSLEEVLLLERPEGWFAPEPTPVYTRQPLHISGQDLTAGPVSQDGEAADDAPGQPTAGIPEGASPEGAAAARETL